MTVDRHSILAELTNTLEASKQEWFANWQAFHSDGDLSAIYHYTTSQGLLGILGSECFWGTNILYLNDKSELLYARTLIETHIDRQIRAAPNSDVYRFLSLLKHRYDPFQDNLDVYISCFCENGDLLSQWRSYGSAGGGYAVALEPRVRDQPPATPAFISFRRVIYDPDVQRAYVEGSINKFVKILAEFRRNSPGNEIWEAAEKLTLRYFLQEVGDYFWCFKDQAFSEEKEWRFAYVTPRSVTGKRPVRFRSTSNGIVPYVELDLFNLASGGRYLQITKIVCGPTLHPDLSELAVLLAVRELGYKDVQPAISAVPLRG